MLFRKKSCKFLGIFLALMMFLGQLPVLTMPVQASEAGGTILFQDDFEDGNLSEWTQVNDVWSVVNEGGSNQLKPSEGWTDPDIHFIKLSDPSSNSWTDVSVEADITITAADYGHAGVNARYTNNNNRYYFNLRMRTNPTFEIVKKKNGTETELARVVAQNVYPGGIQLGKTYNVKGVVKGNKLQMYVDSVLVAEATDNNDPIASGTIALSGYKSNALYDNVKVVDLNEMPEPPEEITDAYLSDLVLAADEELENEIGWTVTGNTYSATVDNEIEKLFIQPVVSGENYSLTINGESAIGGEVFGPINLVPGSNEVIIVISEEGKIDREYVINIFREYEDIIPGEPSKPLNGIYNNYFGNTHAHTDASASHGDPNAGPDYFENNTPDKHFEEAKLQGYDFYFLTDHSQYANTFTPEKWANMLVQCENYTDETFVGIRGFEFSENQDPKGHMNVYNTNDYISADDPGVNHAYMYNWLFDQRKTAPDAVACFNHPGTNQYNDWDFLTVETRKMVTMLEVINGVNPKTPDGKIIGNLHYSGFLRALEKGWRVSPVAGLDSHLVMAIAKPIYRTCIVAESLTKESLLEAMNNRRTYATFDKNLSIQYSVNNQMMGSVLEGNPSTFNFHIWAHDPDTEDPNSKITKIEIMKDNGELMISKSFDDYTVQWNPVIEDSNSDYFFVRVWSAGKTDGPTAYVAPVWIERPGSPEIPEGLPEMPDIPEPPEEPVADPYPGVPSYEVLFEDDFEDGDASDWTVTYGNWSVVDVNGNKQYEKDNTFTPHTIGFSYLNVPGSMNWTDYSVEADVTFLEKGGSGPRAEISVRFHDNTKRYAFTLMDGMIQIRKRNPGENVLAKKSYTVQFGRQYNIKGVVVGNRLEMWVDGVKELEVVDTGLGDEPAIPDGTVCLSNYLASVRYDNIKVVDLSVKPLYEDTFEDQDVSNWRITYGNWYLVETDDSTQFEKDADYTVTSIGFAVLDSVYNADPPSNWTDYAVSADMTVLDFGSGGRAEISARFSDNTVRYAFVITSSGFQIKKRNPGDNVIANVQHTIEIGRKYRVTGALIGNKLEMWVDGEKVLEVVDDGLKNEPAIPSGTIALSNYMASVRYDNIKVIDLTNLPEEPELPVTDIVLDDLAIAEDQALAKIIQTVTGDHLYTANVPYEVTEVYIKPTVNSSAAYTLRFGDEVISSGDIVGPIPLETGTNEFVIKIEEEEHLPREYKVVITRANVTNITVDASDILVTREGNNIAGLCLSWVTDSDKYEREHTMAEVIKNYKFGTIRWPMGTLAMKYVWNTMDENGQFHYPIQPRFIVPNELRNNFSFAATDEDGVIYNEMDFDEFLDLVAETGATAVIDVNVGADLIPGQMVNGKPLTYEDIKLMAAEQVRYAKERGFTGLYWEIGNEVENIFNSANMPGKTESERVQEYIRRYLEFYDVMKAEDPTAKIGIGLHLAAQKYNWHMPVMIACRDKMDFIVTHQYGGHNFSGAGIPATYEGYLNNDFSQASHSAQKILLISDYIDELADEYGEQYRNKYEILVTEYSSHRSSPGWFDYSGGVMYKALHNFEILAEMMNHPRVGPTHFWITRSPWNTSSINQLMNYDASIHDHNALLWDGNLTPMGMSVAIMSMNAYKSMVRAETDNFRVRPYATYDPDTNALTIFILNRENNDVAADIAINNYEGLDYEVSAFVFKGKNGLYYDSEYVYEEIPAPQIQGSGFSTTLSPVSVTVIKFIPEEGETEEFFGGVLVEGVPGDFTITIDRSLLPDGMKDFTHISVCGTDDISRENIIRIINETVQYGYGLQPYTEDGYSSTNQSPYNIIMLFDDDRNCLGYCILDMSFLEMPFEITNTSIEKEQGISVVAHVSPKNGFAGRKAAVIFKLMRGDTVIGVYSSMQDISKTVKFNVQFHGYTGSDYSVKVYVWDKLDSSADSIGINLAEPAEVQ